MPRLPLAYSGSSLRNRSVEILPRARLGRDYGPGRVRDQGAAAECRYIFPLLSAILSYLRSEDLFMECLLAIF